MMLKNTRRRSAIAIALVTGMALPPETVAAAGRPDLNATNEPDSPTVASYRGAGGPMASRGMVDVMIKLAGAPATQAYASAMTSRAGASGGDTTDGSGADRNKAGRVAASKAVEANKAAQAAVISAVNQAGGKVLFTTQRVLNGVAAKVQAKDVVRLRRIPGVVSVRIMIPHTRDNANSVPFIGAPGAWVKGLGYRGDGIKLGVIDTGIDYIHTNFGGPGTPGAYAANDTTVTGDVAYYPSTKVAGGYDFAGDDYDAGDDLSVPDPDSDPMDCNGHGSHVAGSAAGYGVNSDGTTYAGAYGDGTAFDSMRIGPGVAPKATIYALRVFGCGGSTNLTAQALEWASDPNGDSDFSDRLDVVNLSLGSSFGHPGDTSAEAADNAAAAGVVVVASAGNSGDTYFISGSPGSSARTIAVASVKDTENPSSFLEVNSPGSIAGYKQATEASSAASVGVIGDVTGDVEYPNDGSSACVAPSTTGCTNFDGCQSYTLTNPIVMVDRGGCGFQVKMDNAVAAGATALLVANNAAGLLFMGGTSTIPAWMIQQTDGTAIKTELAVPNAVNVTLSAGNRGIVSVSEQADTISSFSSRGPGRSGALKPDISSMGNTILSTENGSGTYGISFDGTSMAAPHVAGTMALLRQIHPSWSVAELKALVMNTANHDVTLTTTATDPKVGQGRVGAGRQDVLLASGNSVIAYADDATGRVSVSFDDVEAIEPDTFTKTVRVKNKGSVSRSYDLSYVTQADAAGVTVSTSVPDITVAGGAEATFDVVLDLTPASMKHDRDASVSSAQTGGNRFWLTEEAGYVVLDSVSGGTDLRVPVHAMVRPASEMAAAAAPVDISAGTGSTSVALSGTSVFTGSTLPTDIWSVASVLELTEVSPQILPDVTYDDSADLSHVGVGLTSAGRVAFGIATHSNWDTPQASDTEFDIYIDRNRDGTDDVVLFNYNIGSLNSLGVQDNIVAAKCELSSGLCTYSSSGYLNGITPATIDTNVFNNNVAVIAMSTGASFLNLTGPFDWYVVSFNRESPDAVDFTDIHTYDPTNPGLFLTNSLNGGTVLVADLDAETIDVDYDAAAYAAAGSQGMLVLHHNNAFGNRVQVVPVNAQPAAPSAISPSGAVTDDTPTFTWSAVAGATNYHLVVTDTTSSTTVIDVNPGNVTTYDAPTPLDTTHAYSWKVSAIGPGGEGAYSNVLIFGYAPTGVPTLGMPSGVTPDLTPDFDWSAVPGATKYQILVLNTKTGVYEVNQLPSTNAFTPSTNLTANHAFTWKVRALNLFGGGAYSPTKSFGNPPAMPTSGSPSGLITDTTPTFTWTAGAGATGYQLLVFDNNTGTYAINTIVTGTSYTPSVALNNTHTYKWRVRGLNAVGGSAYTTYTNFNY
jgi:subtilisin family serine protease